MKFKSDNIEDQFDELVEFIDNRYYKSIKLIFLIGMVIGLLSGYVIAKVF